MYVYKYFCGAIMVQERIYLDENDKNLYLDTYASFDTSCAPRDAILIFPGGGYSGCSPREAEPIALAFLGLGVNCFVLNYRTGSDNYLYPTQLTDASRAIVYIKQNASKYGIDPTRVFVMGFSAGGHLAGSLAYMHNDEAVLSALGIQEGDNKPDGAILCYPVVTALHNTHIGSFQRLLGKPFDSITLGEREYFSLEKHIGPDAPPTFIWHTAEDKSVPAIGSLRLAEKLLENGVTVSMRIYPYGGHGLSLANRITASKPPAGIVSEPQGWVGDVFNFISSLK